MLIRTPFRSYVAKAIRKASLFDDDKHPRDEAGKFSRGAVSDARRGITSGRIAPKKADKPFPSAATGKPIRHYIELPGGHRIHPDELHRMKFEGDDGYVSEDERLTISGGTKGTARTFGHAIAQAKMGTGPTTIQGPHGYSVTLSGKEWAAVTHEGHSFASWHDAEQRTSQDTAGAKRELADAGDFFGQRAAGGSRLFSLSGGRQQVTKKAKADSGGRWITIGGKKGADGKRSGGSPVYIENGRITRGHPSLTGKKIDALDKLGEGASVRTANKMQAGYDRAKWGKEAKEHGVDPKHLHQLAADYKSHASEFNRDHDNMLGEARDALSEFGASWKTIAARSGRKGGTEEGAAIRGMDEVSGYMAEKYPHLFKEPTGDNGSYEDQLFWKLRDGKAPEMDDEEAYTQAMEYLMANKVEDDGTDFDFGENEWKSLHTPFRAYVTKGLTPHVPEDMQDDVAEGPEDAEDDPLARMDALADVLGGLFGEAALKLFGGGVAKSLHVHKGGFSGVITARNGARYHYQDGKRIKGPGKDAGAKPSKGEDGGKQPRKATAPKAGKPDKHQAQAAASEAIGRIKGGDKSPETHKQLLSHLGNMTVAQLTSLKKEHGLKTSAKLKAALVEKLGEHLGHKVEAAPDAGQEAAKGSPSLPEVGDVKGGWKVTHVQPATAPTTEVDHATGKTRQMPAQPPVILAEHPEKGGWETDAEDWHAGRFPEDDDATPAEPTASHADAAKGLYERAGQEGAVTPEHVSELAANLGKASPQDVAAAAQAVGLKLPPSTSKAKAVEQITERIKARSDAGDRMRQIKVVVSEPDDEDFAPSKTPTTPPKPKQAPKPKAQVKPWVKPEGMAIEDEAKEVYGRANDDAITPEHIGDLMGRVGKLDRAGAAKVAEAVGLKVTPSEGKAAIVGKVKQRIEARKGAAAKVRNIDVTGERQAKPAEPATPQAISDHVEAEMSRMIAAGQHNGGMVPIHALRDSVRAKFGEDAASHEKFDDLLYDMWRDGKADLSEISSTFSFDQSGEFKREVTDQQVSDGIPKENGKTLFYLEPSKKPEDQIARLPSDEATPKPIATPLRKPAKPQANADADSLAREAKSTYGRASDKAVTEEMIHDLAARVGTLGRADVVKVAAAIDMKVAPSASKASVVQGIRDRIIARKGSSTRSQLMDRPTTKVHSSERTEPPSR